MDMRLFHRKIKALDSREMYTTPYCNNGDSLNWWTHSNRAIEFGFADLGEVIAVALLAGAVCNDGTGNVHYPADEDHYGQTGEPYMGTGGLLIVRGRYFHAKRLYRLLDGKL